jgi:ABC-type phosphate transport system substrate-binding protein
MTMRPFVGCSVPSWLLLIGILAAIGLAPDAASASLGEQCSGASIAGKGTELQQSLQSSWNASFNKASDNSPRACSGTQGAKLKPGVTYSDVPDRTGLEAWGVDGYAADFGVGDAFIGTGEPPNAIEREEIAAHSSLPPGDSLETIPVLQYPIAIIMRLPSDCRASGTTTDGLIVLKNKWLEEIWRGKIHDWEEILGGSTGNQFMKVAGCKPNTPITRVVNSEGSGPSATLKKYLYLINKEKTIVGTRGWRELAEGASDVEWPGTVIRPSEGSEEAIVELVAKTPGSIGFVTLATADKRNLFNHIGGGGRYRERLVAAIQDDGLNAGAPSQAYRTPDTNLCDDTEYIDPEKGGLPPTIFSLWNGVTANITQPANAYSLCGLSYDLTLTKYSQYPGTSEAEATTVNNFLKFALSESIGGGEEGKQSLPLPLLEVARRGAERIQY